MKILWTSLGIIALGLGLVGMFLPVLPTVPFFLFAAFAFTRGSQTIHAWMLRQTWYQNSVEAYHDQGGLTRPQKRKALIVSISLMGLSMILVGSKLAKVIIFLAILLMLFIFWKHIPTVEPREQP